MRDLACQRRVNLGSDYFVMERAPSGGGSGIVGADSGLVLVWDLAEPRTGPVELDRTNTG
jgi:hypothetical protein